MKRVLGSHLGVVALTLFMLSWTLHPGTSHADGGQNLSPEGTVSRLTQLRHDIEVLRSLVRQPLTSPLIQGSCRECTQHIIFCVRHTTVGWKSSTDFSGPRGRLESLLHNAETHASTFSQSYQPITRWLQEIPQVTADFQSADGVIHQVRTEIQNGDGPTEYQRTQVHLVLQILHQALETNLSHLHAGTGALTSYLHRQSGDREQAKAAEKNLEATWDTVLKEYERTGKTLDLECARTQYLAQVHSVKANYLTAIGNVRQALTQLEVTSHQAEQGLAHLVAETVSAQNEVRNAIDRIEATQKDQLGSFLEQLHFDSALHTWEQLADRVHAFSASNPWPMPAHAPSGKPWCGDFEDGINWPAPGVQQATPRGFMPSSYQPRDGVEGALFAGSYQWGGERCGGWCTSNHGHPHCTLRKP